jgi:prolyl 4-hydroxylase
MVASIRSCVASSWVVYLGTIAVFAGCAVASAFSGDQSLGTITTLAWSPRAFLFHGFATREECEHVRALARPYMQRSTVVGDDDEDAVSSVRTSYGTFLSRFQDGTLAALEERIALWTHLNVTHQEDPQVLRYAPGQEYKAHMDDLEEEVPRIATVILYLSDVEMGGETVFPLRNISVSPKMGDALLFWSLDGSMQEDQYALHAGAPVQRGVKVRYD